MKEKPTCNVCNQGKMHTRTVHRLGNVVAAIGYILLIPSVIAMVVTLGMAALTFISGVGAATVPEDGSGGAAIVAGGILGSGFLCVFIAEFVGSLLGWLLILRKKILKCDHCGAVVAAS